MVDAGVQEQGGTSIGEVKGAVYCLEEEATSFLPRTGLNTYLAGYLLDTTVWK